MVNFRGWSVALVSALLLSTAVHGQIVIGQTVGITGAVAATVKEASLGANLYIDAVNEKGGIRGEKIELIKLDDKFDPGLASENARQLIVQKQVLALFMSRGTPHTEAIAKQLEKYGVVLIAPSTGAMVLHRPVNKYIFNVRSTYQRESEKIITHLHTQSLKRIAVVHVDDSFGEDALEGARKGFAKSNLEPVTVIKVNRIKPDYPVIVNTLTRANPQAILWVGSGTAVSDGIKSLRRAGLGAQIVTLSNNASAGFIQSLGGDSAGVIISQVFPNERAAADPFVSEALGLAKAKGLSSVSPAMLEGFAAAKVLVEALRRVSPQPTRGKLLAALDGLRKFDLGGGLEITYAADDHTGLDFVDLSIIDADGKFRR